MPLYNEHHAPKFTPRTQVYIMHKYKCNFTGFTGNVLDLKQLVLRKMSEHIYASRCDARDVMGHHPKYELL